MTIKDLTKDSIISLQNLTIIKEVDEFTLGDEKKNIYFRVPIEATYVIQEANGIKSIKEIEDTIKVTKQVDIDVLDFIINLNKLGLIEDIDTLQQHNLTKKSWTILLGKIFFNKFTTVFYSLNVLLLFILFIIDYETLLPSYRDTFVFTHIDLSLLLFFIVSWLLVFIHELAHYFAVSAYGKKMKLQLSVRWFWIVIEADMNSLWLIPRNHRYIPFLAGFFWDVLILNTSLIISLFIENGLFLNILKMISLIQFYKILWQFIIFLRTDFYYVIINYLGISNLTKGSISYLLRKFSHSQKNFFDKFNNREQRICKRYSYLYLISIVIMSYLFFSLSLPATIYAIRESFQNISTFNMNNLIFWDSSIVLSIFLLELVLWIIGGYQKWRREGT